jgi:hypothetical protein
MASLFRTVPIAATLLLSPCAPAPTREIDNVSAFAHLYGVLRFFYPSDAAAGLDWNRFAVHGVSRVRAARSPADLERALNQLVAPLGPGVEIGARPSPPGPVVASGERLVAWRYLGAGLSTSSESVYRAKRTHRASPPSGPADTELFPEWAPSPGAHTDLDLGSGLKARVALVLSDAQASVDPARKADLDVLRAALAGVGGPSDTPGIDQRLADVVVVWSAFRHFYPYWTEAAVDWDSRLAPRLTEAAAATTRAAQHDALRGLAADARDGHGFVADTLDKTERGELPVRLAVVERRAVGSPAGRGDLDDRRAPG